MIIDKLSPESDQVVLVLYMKAKIQLNGASLENLVKQLRVEAAAMHMTSIGPAKLLDKTYSVALDSRKPEERHEGEQACAVVGNFTEGYKVIGPYPDIDFAAQAFDVADVWITTLHAPANLPTFDKLDIAAHEAYNAVTEDYCEDELQEALDDLVHDVFASKAADVNNDCMEAQITFLVQDMGCAETLKAIHEKMTNE